MGAQRITERNNYLWLLVALLLLLFAAAIFEQLGINTLRRFAGLLLTVTILVGVWSVDTGVKTRFRRLLATAFLVSLIALEQFLHHPNVVLLLLVVSLLFCMVTIAICCRQVLFSGYVDVNKIIGSICIYMLLGIAWGLVYMLVEQFFPGSIPGLEGGDWPHDLQRSLYFSFISLTTLGYGDISPVQPLAQLIAYLQAITGQFYVAILVASLVGVRMADRG